MARTWIYQDPKQVAKHGEKASAWYAAWIDPAGKQRCKSCGPGSRGKRDAERLADSRRSELSTGTYENPLNVSWASFKADYTTKAAAKMGPANRAETLFLLKTFERLVGPKKIATITTQDIDEYVAKRMVDTERRIGKTKTLRNAKTVKPISPATINKELRYLRSVLRKAQKWGMIAKVPDFTFLKVPVKVPTFIDPEDFAKIYDNAGSMKRPINLPFPAAEWWKGLLVTAYMTGWRINELLTLRWEDVDLDAGTAFLRADNTKAGREEFVTLHPLVVDHLRTIRSFWPVVFPWADCERRLWVCFHKLQDNAGVKPRGKEHYGFHDLRRGFATMNAERLTTDTLQRIMRHKSYSTTQLYVNMAKQMQSASDKLFVPSLTPAKEVKGG